MAGPVKKRQQTIGGSSVVDLSHCTRPKLDPLVQQTLESVGMRSRKAFSDAMYRKQMSDPLAQKAMKAAIESNVEIAKPLPYFESKSATDPWAKFREIGRANMKQSNRVSKRGREEEPQPVVPVVDERAFEHSASTLISNDPNDLEFTNPPWLASQESLQSDDEMFE